MEENGRLKCTGKNCLIKKNCLFFYTREADATTIFEPPDDGECGLFYGIDYEFMKSEEEK